MRFYRSQLIDVVVIAILSLICCGWICPPVATQAPRRYGLPQEVAPLLAIAKDKRSVCYVNRLLDSGRIEIATGKQTYKNIQSDDPAVALAITTDASFFVEACGGSRGFVSVTDGLQGKKRAMIRRGRLYTDTIGVSHNGGIIAVGLAEGVVELYELIISEARHEIRLLHVLIPSKPTLGSVSALAFSQDAKLLAVGCDGDTVVLWDIPARKISAILPTKQHAIRGVRTVVFTPDGNHILAGTNGGFVQCWDVRTGKARVVLEEESCVTSLTVTHDGKRFASGCRTGDMSIWEMDSWKRQTWRAHREEISSLVFTEKPQRIISGGADGLIKLWSIGKTKPDWIVNTR